MNFKVSTATGTVSVSFLTTAGLLVDCVNWKLTHRLRVTPSRKHWRQLWFSSFVFYLSHVHDELKQQFTATRHNPKQSIIDSAIDQWRKRLTACVKAKGWHFEYQL